jgi:UDP-N-acetylmuramoyl-tripeptide--D-alanyl-D-alanine ligase
MRNAAVAITVALSCGVDAAVAAHAIGDAVLTGHRMEIAEAGGLTLVNDVYNANPTSTSSAIRTVAELAGASPAWAVLGEMAELGTDSEAAHERIGRLVAAHGYAGVVAIGDAAAGIARGAGSTAVRVGSIDDALDVVREQVPSGAFVLVKASRAVGLELLVQRFLDAR